MSEEESENELQKFPEIQRKSFFDKHPEYKEGDIITIGSGPYFHKDKAERRKKYQLKEFVNIEGGEDYWKAADEIEAYEAELRGEAEESEDEYNSSDEEEIMVNEAGEIIFSSDLSKNPVKSKAKWEQIEDLEFKSVNIFSGDTLQLAKILGLETKHDILVPKSYKERLIPGKNLKFKAYDQYIISKDVNGKLYLKQVVGKVRAPSAEILDQDVFPLKIPTNFYPKTGIIPKAPNYYKGNLKFGECVSFVQSTVKKMYGVVVNILNKKLDLVTPLGEVILGIPLGECKIVNEEKLPSKYKGGKPDDILVAGQTFVLQKGNKKQDKKYVGKYVEFVWSKNEILTGRISGYESDGFIVSIINETYNGARDRIVVFYDDPTITNAICPSGKKLEYVYTPDDPEDYLMLSVDFNTRQAVTKLFFIELSKIIGDVYYLDLEDDKAMKKLHNEIEWDVIKSDLKSWDDYYATQFYGWYVATMLPLVGLQVPDFSVEAEEIRNTMVDPDILVEILVGEFGDNLFDGDASDMLTIMKEKLKETDFEPNLLDVYLIGEISKMPENNAREMKGASLAGEVSRLILNYLLLYPPSSTEEIRIKLETNWMMDEIKKIDPDENSRSQFDTEYLSQLKEIYKSYKENWEKSKKLSEIYLEKRKNLQNEIFLLSQKQDELPQEFRAAIGKTVEGKQLNERGLKLAKNVVQLEKNLYLESMKGKTNIGYLYLCLKLLVFLDAEDFVGKHARFLRAKVKSGLFPVETLDRCTFAHIFPEFFANNNLSNADYEKGLKELEIVMINQITDFIENWILKRPSKKHPDKGGISWDKLAPPIVSTCENQFRVKKGGKFQGNDDLDYYQYYDCKEKNVGTKRNPIIESYDCKAKVEPIPENDLVICYDEKTGKFTCTSLNDILYALNEETHGKTPINYITKNPYDKKFLKRMRERYTDMLLDPNTPDRILEFKATEHEILWGERSPKKVKGKVKKSAKKVEKRKSISVELPVEKEKVVKSVQKEKRIVIEDVLENLNENEKLVILFQPPGSSEDFDEILFYVSQNYDAYTLNIPSKERVDVLKQLKLKKAPIWVVFKNKDSKRIIIIPQKGKTARYILLEELGKM
jgi:hypothetical protein